MAKHDDEVAALYQLPPGEFTAGRNALATKLGPAGAQVRRLEKPQAAAWAVNQLYWQRRPAYDDLVRASQAMRTAHTNMLSGRKADVPQAESAHRDAVRAATVAIRELAQLAGEALSAGTLDAVAETLRALPSDDPPGQLARPLKPMGMEALMGIGIQGARSGASTVGVQESNNTGVVKRTAAERAAEQKEAAAREKQRKALQKALKEAEAAERDAESALTEARKAVAKVERDYQAVRDRLQFLEKQRSDAEQEAHKRARDLQDAANARTQAAQDLQRAE
ncbi:MAG: hypothetical protein ABIP90_03375 [Vicinamibacterales bacterium]